MPWAYAAFCGHALQGHRSSSSVTRDFTSDTLDEAGRRAFGRIDKHHVIRCTARCVDGKKNDRITQDTRHRTPRRDQQVPGDKRRFLSRVVNPECPFSRKDMEDSITLGVIRGLL